MPWRIAPDHPKCGRGKFAVVKGSDGSVAGCHASKADAKKQMAALYAKEPGMSGAGRSEEVDMAAVERRYTPGLVELQRASDDKGPRIGGLAIVFNALSRNLGGFVERSAPSVVNKSRADGWPEVVARFDHENAFLLGTIAGRTLSLSVEEPQMAGNQILVPGGLRYLVDPPRSRGDIVELVERGDVHKSSFAFRVPPGGDDWATTDQGYPMRTLLDVTLVDVAPVVSPAYTDTSVGLESLARHFDADPEEIRSMAATDELRRLFVKTEAGMPAGKPKPRKLGAVAALPGGSGRVAERLQDEQRLLDAGGRHRNLQLSGLR